MTMAELSEFGTNADGSRSEEYCCYCWENGAFLEPNQTLEGAIESNIPYLIEYGMAKTEDEAREMLQETMPVLKRWVL